MYSLNDSNVDIILLCGYSLKQRPHLWNLIVDVNKLDLRYFKFNLTINSSVPVCSLWTRESNKNFLQKHHDFFFVWEIFYLQWQMRLMFPYLQFQKLQLKKRQKSILHLIDVNLIEKKVPNMKISRQFLLQCAW